MLLEIYNNLSAICFSREYTEHSTAIPTVHITRTHTRHGVNVKRSIRKFN